MAAATAAAFETGKNERFIVPHTTASALASQVAHTASALALQVAHTASALALQVAHSEQRVSEIKQLDRIRPNNAHCSDAQCN
jgi:hypothetical protein